MREISSNPDRKGGLLAAFLISFLLLELVAITFIRSYPVGFPLLFAVGLMIALPLIGAFVLIFVVYLIWRVFGLFLWLIARLIGGKGTQRDTTGILGYALVPIAVGLLLSNLVWFLLTPTASEGEDYIEFVKDINPNIIGYIILPFLIWSVYIVGLGIQHVHSMDRQVSFVLAGGMAAIFYAAFILNLI